jgi:D-amino peptidase
MVSGDQTACAEAVETLGAVEVAVVKQATGRMAAECLPPEAAQEKIREAASRAVNRLHVGRAASPYRRSPSRSSSRSPRWPTG